MNKTTVTPADHWSLKIEIPFSMGLACGDLIFLCGQADLEGNGNVCHPNDLLAQSAGAIGHIVKLFAELDASAEELAKLTVFYVPDESIGEIEYLTALAQMLPSRNRPAITLIPVPRMFYPGLRVEIDAYGIRSASGERHEIPGAHGFADLVRAGEMIFSGGISAVDAAGDIVSPGDVVAQSHAVLARVCELLAEVGAEVGDVVKINNWYVAGGSAAEWARSARVRAAFYPEPGPCATGVPVHDLHLPGTMIRTDFWAMLGRDGRPMAKTHCWPEGHWDWPFHLPFKHGLRCGNLVFIGGQVSLDSDGRVIDPGQMEAQTHTSMQNIARVLDGFDLDYGNLVKLNTYYQGADDGDDLHRNVSIRASYFDSPGPASTGIPFRCLAYDGMLIEIEAIAMAAPAQTSR